MQDYHNDSSGYQEILRLWFLCDVFMNFFTMHVDSDGEVCGDFSSVAYRYLTTWFVVDVLSLVPWELFLVQPLINEQARRGWITKAFFRTKGVVKVTTIVRGKHVRWFNRVKRQTKVVGVGGGRLLKAIIKYLPKYMLYFKRMRIVLPVRVMRVLHVCRKIGKDFVSEYSRDMTEVDDPGRFAKISRGGRRLSAAVNRVIEKSRLREVLEGIQEEGGIYLSDSSESDCEEEEGGRLKRHKSTGAVAEIAEIGLTVCGGGIARGGELRRRNTESQISKLAH